MSNLKLTAEQRAEFNIVYERIAADDIALQDFITAAIYCRAELERQLTEMTAARDYEKAAHKRSVDWYSSELEKLKFPEGESNER